MSSARIFLQSASSFGRVFHRTVLVLRKSALPGLWWTVSRVACLWISLSHSILLSLSTVSFTVLCFPFRSRLFWVSSCEGCIMCPDAAFRCGVRLLRTNSWRVFVHWGTSAQPTVFPHSACSSANTMFLDYYKTQQTLKSGTDNPFPHIS